METEFLVETGSWLLISFVKIDDLPSLVLSIISFGNINNLTFNIFVSSDFETLLVSDVAEVRSFILEELEPSSVSTPDLHVVSLSSMLDIP